MRAIATVAVIAIAVASGCGLRKPYGVPCPPAPAQAGIVTEGMHAFWTGNAWYCPPTTDTWVDDKAALAGSDSFVYCVPKTPSEIQGIDGDGIQTDEPIAPQFVPVPYRSERLERL